MFRRNEVIYSPIELNWLEDNKNLPIDQICIALSKSRNSVKRKLQELDGKVFPGKKGKKSFIGKRKDLNNQFLRSSWEANTCRVLKYNNIDYIYEPKVFYFEGIKHGTISYLPDLYLPKLDIYLEIKGQLTSQGRVAVKRFQKYFPEEAAKLQAITGRPSTKATQFFNLVNIPIYAFYYELEKQYKSLIETWE